MHDSVSHGIQASAFGIDHWPEVSYIDLLGGAHLFEAIGEGRSVRAKNIVL